MGWAIENSGVVQKMAGSKNYILVVGFVAIFGGCSQDGASSFSTRPWINNSLPNPPDHGPIEDAEVLRLLKQYLSDRRQEKKINAAVSSHLKIGSDKFWYAFYATEHAHERLINLGSGIIDPCIRIASDSKQSDQVAEAAFRAGLFPYDDLRIVTTLMTPAFRTRFSVLHNDVLVLDYLQFHSVVGDKAGFAEDGSMIRLLKQLAMSKDYSPILRLLDAAMDTGNFGLFYGNPSMIRWLNRIEDQDIDELLAVKAPLALAWRNEQLKKGFDPLVAFYYDDFRIPLYHHTLDGVLKKVYSDPADRRLCLELFQAVYSDNDTYFGKEGWQDRLRTWYWKNRDSLVYDFEKHRFVVKRK